MIAQVFTFKNAFVLLLVALLLIGSLGISHMAMSMDMEGNMIDCPFMPGVSICTMSPMEMVAASQGFLSNITLNQDQFLLLVSVALVLSVFAKFFSPPRSILRYRIPKRKSPTRFDFLEEAFSSGLLNPKLF